MGNPNNKFIHVTWSGGIDSTALIGLLLLDGWIVQPVVLGFGHYLYKKREEEARNSLADGFFMQYGERFKMPITATASWLHEFSHDGTEITRRNKHILDYMMQRFVIPTDGYYIGMGEYIGADTWLVKDHVGAHDADSRYLAAYLLHEYGLGYRFMALNDFGESRYKVDRVRLLVNSTDEGTALMTTNCMENSRTHCGKCYKCIERHVAFKMVLGNDNTKYDDYPDKSPMYSLYEKQMQGQDVDMPWDKAKRGG